MNRCCIAYLVLLLAWLALPATAEKIADEQIIQTHDRYMAAMAAGEYEEMAQYLHPGELEEFKRLFVTLGESAEDNGVFGELGQILGADTLADLKAMPSEQMFANLFKMLTRMIPEFGQILKSAKVTLLGQVTEGEGEFEIVHLVFRMKMQVNGVEVNSVDTAAMKKADDGKYYFLLGEEVQGLIQALKGQFGQAD